MDTMILDAGDYVRIKADTKTHAEATKQLRDIGAIGQVVFRDDHWHTALVRFADRNSDDRLEPGHSCYSFPLSCWELVDIEAMSSGKPYEVLTEQDIDAVADHFLAKLHAEHLKRVRFSDYIDSMPSLQQSFRELHAQVKQLQELNRAQQLLIDTLQTINVVREAALTTIEACVTEAYLKTAEPGQSATELAFLIGHIYEKVQRVTGVARGDG